LASPLQQFEIKPLIQLPEVAGYDISFTNSSLMMMLASILVITVMSLSTRSHALIPGRGQAMAEMAYDFIASMLRENAGKDGQRYFPLIFSIFMFVLFCNLLGMLPYSFTATSHIAVTFAMAIVLFIALNIIALARHGLHFFSFFLPAGTPWWMAPVMYMIELFAYLARPVSLSVRLAANMMAGHTMLKVIAGFVISLGFAFGWIPLSFLVILTGFEIFVAFLQAYIFAVLTCVYLNDALHLH
jgi:F-type H+-transporting ATPase subunit a